MDIVINHNPNFEAKIFSSNEELKKRFKSVNDNYEFNFADVNKDVVSSLPNFFKINMSLGFIISKMKFTKVQQAATALTLLFLIASPSYLIHKNIQNTKSYNQATFEIFTSISNRKDFRSIWFN